MKKVIKKIKKLKEEYEKGLDADFAENIKEAKPPIKKPKEVQTVDISLWSATKIIVAVLILMLVQKLLGVVGSVLFIFFFSLFLAAAFNPGVDFLERKFKIPRALGMIILYLLVFAVLFLIIGGVIPAMITQTKEMLDWLIALMEKAPEGSTLAEARLKLEDYSKQFNQFVNNFDFATFQGLLQNFLDSGSLNRVAGALASFFGFIGSIVSGILNFILIILLTFFMVTERDGIKSFFTSLFPAHYKDYISTRSTSVQKKIGEWIHGQISLFVIMAIIAFIGLELIGVKFALTLALVAGLAEFIPFLGPILAFATALPIAFTSGDSPEIFSPLTGLITTGFYVFLQILEGNVLVPLVMKKAVGISPIVTIIAMLIGWELGSQSGMGMGVIGIILSVPIASILTIFIKDFTKLEAERG
jgi:predicted PurR-regulated permease PerM